MFNGGVTSTHGHVVIGEYRTYKNAMVCTGVYGNLHPVSNVSTILQQVPNVSFNLQPVSNLTYAGQQELNMSSIS